MAGKIGYTLTFLVGLGIFIYPLALAETSTTTEDAFLLKTLSFVYMAMLILLAGLIGKRFFRELFPALTWGFGAVVFTMVFHQQFPFF